jgi:hypothetical protein
MTGELHLVKGTRRSGPDQFLSNDDLVQDVVVRRASPLQRPTRARKSVLVERPVPGSKLNLLTLIMRRPMSLSALIGWPKFGNHIPNVLAVLFKIRIVPRHR